MSFNGGTIFTARGRALQAKAQAGAELVFTRLAVGDGQIGSQAIEDLTALINPIKSLTINKFKTMTGGKAVVGGKLSNQDIVTGFYWRELGLFATDPDLGEVLYCYGNAGALAEYIPSPGGAEILEKQVDIVSIVGNAADISANIDQSLVYVSIADFEGLAGAGRTTETVKDNADAIASLAVKTAEAHPTTHDGNAYSVTVSGLTALTDGYPLTVKFDAVSTGAITVNPSGLGAKAVVDYFGNPVANVRANLIANLRYDATNGNFQLLGKGGGGNATAPDLLSGKTATADTGQITGTMPNNGAVTYTPSLNSYVDIAAGYHSGSRVNKIGNMFTVPKVFCQASAPSSPSVNDFWVKTSKALAGAHFQNTAPTSSLLDGDIWIKITDEYINPASFTTSNPLGGTSHTFAPRVVSRDYDVNGGKSALAILIADGTIYDLYAIPGFVKQYNSSTASWVYCPAYYWNGSAWVQHSWSDFYIYGGNPVYKIAPDQTMTTISSDPDLTNPTIVRTGPSGKIYVASGSYNWVKCYDFSGTLLWTYTPTLNTSCCVKDICFDLDGNIYIMRSPGSTTVYVDKISSSGTFIGEVTIPYAVKKIKVDNYNRLLCLSGLTSSTLTIYCFNPDWTTNSLGSTVWSKAISSASTPLKFDIDADRNVYVNCSTNLCYKVTSDGSTATSFSADGRGGIVVTPTKIYCASYTTGSTVIKVFDYTLNQIYTVTYTLSNYNCPNICVDKDGYIYLFLFYGTGSTPIKIVKLPPDSATPLFTVTASANSGIGGPDSIFDVTPGLYSNFPSAW